MSRFVQHCIIGPMGFVTFFVYRACCFREFFVSRELTRVQEASSGFLIACLNHLLDLAAEEIVDEVLGGYDGSGP